MARLHTGVHFWFEEPECAAAISLGKIKRHIGVLEQCIGVGAVTRGQRDTDANTDGNVVTLKSERFADCVDEPLD